MPFQWPLRFGFSDCLKTNLLASLPRQVFLLSLSGGHSPPPYLLMVLTGNKCLSHIKHTLGGELSPAIDGLGLINEVGEFLASAQAWKWLETAEAKLDLRAKISIAGGTTNSGAGTTFTKSGAFTNYTFLEGDTVEVISGTGVTAGHHRVVSKTDANVIVLETTPGASGSAIAATLHTSAIALPSDFREIIAINTTSGLLKGVELTTFGDLLSKRAASFTSSGYHYGAISQPTDTDLTVDGAPVARLEIWPQPSANETAAITIMYRAGWKRITKDTHRLRLPVYCESLYIQFLRAFARGYEEEDEFTVSQRLTEIMSGPLFGAAVDRDASIQSDYGPSLHGATESNNYGSPFANFNTIPGPS